MKLNPFASKQMNTQQSQQSVDPRTGDGMHVVHHEIGQFLIVTAATNFGLVVSPRDYEPIVYKMDENESIAECVARRAPFISQAVEVSKCLVVELVAELPNHTKAANKIFALILPDPGILINENLAIVGYEQINTIPSPTQSLLQMLVKQVPSEYFAAPKVEAGWRNPKSTQDSPPEVPKSSN
jgi:hypothetical protein